MEFDIKTVAAARYIRLLQLFGEIVALLQVTPAELDKFKDLAEEIFKDKEAQHQESTKTETPKEPQAP